MQNYCLKKFSRLKKQIQQKRYFLVKDFNKLNRIHFRIYEFS